MMVLSEEKKEKYQTDQKSGNQFPGQPDGYDQESRNAGNDQNQQTDEENPAFRNSAKHFSSSCFVDPGRLAFSPIRYRDLWPEIRPVFHRVM